MSRCLIFRSNDEAAILDWEDTRKSGAGKMVHKGGDSGNTREGIVGTKGRTIMTGKRSLSVPLLSGSKNVCT